VTGCLRELHTKEIYHLYSSPHTIRAIKLRMGETCSTHGSNEIRTQFWSENMRGNDHLNDVGVMGG
jgi:hypothetical protein